MTMYARSLAVLSLLFVQNAFAGIVSVPPAATSVPLDSPWVIAGLVLTLAVVGARLLHNRRK